MRWRRQRRQAPARHAAGRAPATWAEAAAPPPQQVPPPHQVAPPQQVPPPPPVASQPLATVQPSVQLGFADGTSVAVDAASPVGAALRAVADVLAEHSRR